DALRFRERFGEQLHVARDARQRLDHQLRGAVHLHAGLHRAGGLFGQVGGAAIPELGGVEHGVEDRGRVARAALPAVADRRGHVVGAAGADAVAGVAGDHVAARQARLEEQHPAQLHPLRGHRAAADLGGRLGITPNSEAAVWRRLSCSPPEAPATSGALAGADPAGATAPSAAAGPSPSIVPAGAWMPASAVSCWARVLSSAPSSAAHAARPTAIAPSAAAIKHVFHRLPIALLLIVICPILAPGAARCIAHDQPPPRLRRDHTACLSRRCAGRGAGRCRNMQGPAPPPPAMTDHRTRFLRLPIDARALRFGEFVLKSDRTSTFIFNAWRFDSGTLLSGLAACYVDALEQGGTCFDMLFGPAYKGMPLATALAC